MHSINYTYSSGKNRLASIATAGDIVSSTSQYDAVGNLKRDVAENVIIQWNLAGKVKQVNTPDYMLQYSYSPLGQRQIKLVEPINIDKGFQYYLHDATGNIMCIYDLPNNDTLSVIERVVYGSSRIGINRKVIAINSDNWGTLPDTNRFRGYCGYRNFELSNHLGNVLTTFSDRKQGMDDNSDGIVDYYRPVVTSWTDYYPFGYPMPNRNWSGTDYRFGFNGQEKNNEIYGEGESYTAEFWQYDSRLGRRWNMDPKGEASISLYACFGDNPIMFSDILGDTLRTKKEGADYTLRGLNNTLGTENPFYYNEDISEVKYDETKMNSILENQEKYDPKQLEIINTVKTLIDEGNNTIEMVDFDQTISSLGSSLKEMHRAATTDNQNNSNVFYIARNYQEPTGEIRNIPTGPNSFRREEYFKVSTSDDIAITVLHEFRHAYLYIAFPTLIQDQNNKNVEDFETNTRSIYVVKTKHNGKKIFMGGQATPHLEN